MSGLGVQDDTGAMVPIPARVSRVVSLVPSLTETVAVTAPGLVAGATDWCTHPAGLDVPRVRGTKNPDLAAVVALRPDVVLANEEENRPADLAALREAGLPVWVTVIRTLDEALVSLRRLLTVACQLPAPRWLEAAERVWAAFPPDVPGRPGTPSVTRRSRSTTSWPQARSWLCCRTSRTVSPPGTGPSASPACPRPWSAAVT